MLHNLTRFYITWNKCHKMLNLELHIFDVILSKKTSFIFIYNWKKVKFKIRRKKLNSGTSTISLRLINNLKEIMNQVFCLIISHT